jgi:hypothetical protein
MTVPDELLGGPMIFQLDRSARLLRSLPDALHTQIIMVFATEGPRRADRADQQNV